LEKRDTSIVEKLGKNNSVTRMAELRSAKLTPATDALTGPPETSDFHWYALEIRHRFEKRAVQQISRLGIETFLPQRREIHTWSDRRKAFDVPLFAGYAFVRLNSSRAMRLRVLQASGVFGFVSSHGVPVPVPAEQVEHLRLILQHGLPCSLLAFLRTGQRVRVRGGCLDGIEGILFKDKGQKLVISIACLQRSVSVQIEGYELEAA
jgi:transcription antitermination factor NusG